VANILAMVFLDSQFTYYDSQGPAPSLNGPNG